MSLFTEPVDRYFVAKLVSGLVLFFAGCYVVITLFALAGWSHPRSLGASGRPGAAAVANGVLAVCALLAFRLASRAQARDRGKD